MLCWVIVFKSTVNMKQNSVTVYVFSYMCAYPNKIKSSFGLVHVFILLDWYCMILIYEIICVFGNIHYIMYR